MKSLEEPFITEPAIDFTIPGTDRAFITATAEVRKKLGQTYPLFIGGKEIRTEETIISENPNKPEEIVGKVCKADKEHVDMAVKAAKEAFPKWRDTAVEDRAQVLVKAAQICRDRIYELSAWEVLEVGKQWGQAHADLTEAIDFFEYYAREMIRLGTPVRLGHLPGEVNKYFYEAKGVAAVIAPWNFPIAISAGMCAAALVTGNAVVFKPSELSVITAHLLSDIFREAGVPAGVFNFIPGYGHEIGDHLVEHSGVSLIAFTGSKKTGLKIIEKAAVVHPGQNHVKKVICEMGGKNAIIIDDDADLDQAVPGVIKSAFAFQGQKCSACSRLIVLEDVYDRVVDRLKHAAQSLHLGSPENPENLMGALVDKNALEKTLSYQAIAEKEGSVVYKSDPEEGTGYFAPILIVEGITPEHRIAQEEVFGPVLAVMKVKDFDQALEWANSTEFALTGGLYSRSPKNLERAVKEFRVGNLYLNQPCTGALVGRQAFGGSYMSGAGTKAGGPDYLQNFMDPRVVTENTMRRGFAPAEK